MAPNRKRHRSTPHISQPSYVLPKRPRQTPPSNPSAESLSETWQSLQTKIHTALSRLRQPAIHSIIQALNRPTSDPPLSAVCVTMGACTAAGDRELVFRSIVDSVEGDGKALVWLTSAKHSTFSSVMNVLEEIPYRNQLVVAVEDTELFEETVLRDLVYYCAKRCGENVSSVTLLLGMATNSSSIHSALGIEEATMLTTTMVQMPTPAQSFTVIVEEVLSHRDSIVISKSVFQLLKHDFFVNQSTISMVLRSLKCMYTLHFYRIPLAHLFCRISSDDLATKLESADRLRVHLSEKALETLRHRVASVANANPPVDTSDMQDLCIGWYRDIIIWKARCHLFQQVFEQLFDVCQVAKSEWNEVALYDCNLSILLFQAFLVDHTLSLSLNTMLSLIWSKIKVATRPMLRNIVVVLKQAIESSALHTQTEEASIVSRLEKFADDLESNTRNKKEANAQVTTRNSRKESAPRARGSGAALQRRMLLLQQNQDESVAVKKSDAIGKLRHRIQQIVQDLVQLGGPLHKLPMHELFLFHNVVDLQKYNGGIGAVAEPRNCLFTAMRKPSTILGGITTVPDTPAAYRILAEGGRLVSLYDWYNSFAATVMARKTKADAEGNVVVEPVSSAELQARFARSCSELELLGVLQYSNRKTDHVRRLAYEYSNASLEME